MHPIYPILLMMHLIHQMLIHLMSHLIQHKGNWFTWFIWFTKAPKKTMHLWQQIHKKYALIAISDVLMICILWCYHAYYVDECKLNQNISVKHHGGKLCDKLEHKSKIEFASGTLTPSCVRVSIKTEHCKLCSNRPIIAMVHCEGFNIHCILTEYTLYIGWIYTVYWPSIHCILTEYTLYIEPSIVYYTVGLSLELSSLKYLDV